ncbi:MAG: DHH family phosphoesterase [Thermoanaerobaculia bacterium]
MKVPEPLLRELQQGHRFLITAHLSPDGDAIGSALGLGRLLRQSGKGAVVWLHDPIPAFYGSLPGSDRVHQGEAPPPGFPDGFDRAVVLECPQLARSGLAEALKTLPILNIDHHLGNEPYGRVNWVDSAAPAVGEMIYRLGVQARFDIDAVTATLLLLALAADTGGFRHSNSSPEAFEAAAALVRDGARPEEVARWLHQNRSLASLKLVSEMLLTVELAAADPRVASAVVTRDMFTRSGAAVADTEGLIDYPRSLSGVEAVALLREEEDGHWKISLRSRGDVDVQRIALRHAGGGHHNAAGCRMSGDLDDVRRGIVAELVEGLGS